MTIDTIEDTDGNIRRHGYGKVTYTTPVSGSQIESLPLYKYTGIGSVIPTKYNSALWPGLTDDVFNNDITSIITGYALPITAAATINCAGSLTWVNVQGAFNGAFISGNNQINGLYFDFWSE